MKHFSDDETTKHKSANKKMWPHFCLLLLIFCTNASSSDTEADTETVGEKIFRKIGEWWTVGLSMGMTNSAWIWQIEQLEWIGRGQLGIFWQKRLIETEMQSFLPLKELLKILIMLSFNLNFTSKLILASGLKESVIKGILYHHNFSLLFTKIHPLNPLKSHGKPFGFYLNIRFLVLTFRIKKRFQNLAFMILSQGTLFFPLYIC